MAKTAQPRRGSPKLDELAESAFVTVVAHQLRTPLSAVKWVMKMLLDGDAGKLTSEQKSLLEKGYQSNERMINLVNDLLNVALIESARLTYRMAPHALADVLDRVLLDFVAPLKRKKITLTRDAPDRLPPVQIDPERIATVLHNLLDNAVQYSPAHGHLAITLHPTGRAVEVTIKDSGIGIPAHQQKKIFTRFYRGENARKVATDGSGVGLFIVKSIVEKHGGRVWFESLEHRGSTFHFTLPSAAAKV